MDSFEDIRLHCASRWPLGSNDPYLLSFDLPLDGGRRQGMFLAELEDERGNRFLRVSTPVAPIDGEACVRALRFNWEQRLGYLAVNDLEDVPYLHLCENRPYELLDGAELDRVVAEIGTLADRLERALAGSGGDLF